jgi:ferredoxin
MKGILYYFSGTGNTKWVAEKFKEQFRKNGIELVLRNIENEEQIDLSGYKYLIVGTPVHAELSPRMVTDFASRLPEGNNIKCIIYSTQGANNAAATDDIRRIIEKKGYNVITQTSFRMANNYYFGVGIERTQEEIINYCKKAEEEVKRITEKFLKGEKINRRASFIRLFFAKVSSRGFYKFLPKLSENLTSTEDCTKCGLCLRNCPRSNITFENGRAIFHSKCIMCTRCIYLCPSNVIRYKGKKINQIQKTMIRSLELR